MFNCSPEKQDKCVSSLRLEDKQVKSRSAALNLYGCSTYWWISWTGDASSLRLHRSSVSSTPTAFTAAALAGHQAPRTKTRVGRSDKSACGTRLGPQRILQQLHSALIFIFFAVVVVVVFWLSSASVSALHTENHTHTDDLCWDFPRRTTCLQINESKQNPKFKN